MSYLVLARKYRPARFSEVVGQTGVVRTLKNAIEMERVAHAYLFTGARGVGKTTVARLLAKALNCERGPTAEPDDTCTSCAEITRGNSPDVFEIDGASNTGVDDVRQLRDNSQYMPAHSRFKIYIIDEVHMLSTSAFNALLKTLEEPPAHVKFIFATTEPHKIPLTVLSRCQRFDFKRIPAAEIIAHLEFVLGQEGMGIDADGLRIIARQAAGSMRDALSLTDQVLAFGGEQISAEQVRQALGLTGTAVYDQVVSSVLDGQADELMRLVDELFDEGQDLKRFLDGLLWHVHQLILFRSLDDPGDLIDLLPEEKDRMRSLSQQAAPLRWHQIFDVLAKTAAELGRSPHPRIVLETALLRLAVIEPVVGIDDLLARVERLAAQIGAGEAVATKRGAGSDSGGSTRPRFQPPPRPRPQPVPDHPNAPGADDPPVAEEFAPPAAAAVSPAAAESTPAGGGPAEKESSGAAPVAPGRGLSGLVAWEKLVAFINHRRPSLGSFLSHAAARQVETGQVILAFEAGSFFGDQVRVPRNKKDLEFFCGEFFGQATRIEVQSLSDDDGPSLAQAREKASREEEGERRRQALEHPMVQEAIRVFGAEVDHVKTQTEKER